ncbi:alkaline phosphatase [Labilibaculum euxinus]
MKYIHGFIALVLIIVSNSACQNKNLKLHDDMIRNESEFWNKRSISHVILNQMIGKETQVIWSTTSHTAAPVPLGAVGPEKYTKMLQGPIQNDSLGRVLKSAVKEKLNVIIVIGDGMGNMHMALPIYERYAQKNKIPTYFARIMSEGACGYLYTGTARGLVTGSAASGTAIACGKKTLMNMIGVDSLGMPLQSALALAINGRYKTAIVTDAGITDATPAAFYAHSINRDAEQKIADQLEASSNIDVILGGGASLFFPKGTIFSDFERVPESLNFESLRTDSRNLIESFQKKDYQFCSTLRQLQNIERGKVIGLFASGGLPAAINRDESTVSIPSVKEMGNKALELISDTDSPYFAMIECARIDWEAHDNDIASVYKAVEEMNQVLKDAYRKYQESPENTLLIFTADHETGGLEVAYRKMPKENAFHKKMEDGEEWENITNPLLYKIFVKNLERQKKSVSSVLGESATLSELKINIREKLGITLSNDEAEQLFYSMTDYKRYKD